MWRRFHAAPTPPEWLSRARSLARRRGVRHVYTGNLWDADGTSTACHGCGATRIDRDGPRVVRFGLDAAGACPSCGTRAAGVFEALPGQWAGKELSVPRAEWGSGSEGD